MRKILLSLIVIVSFIGYVWYMQAKGAGQQVSITPTTIGKKVSNSPAVTAVPSSENSQSTQPSTAMSQPIATVRPSAQYKDGIYTGSVADAFYGPLQVKVTISGSKISDVQFLQAPSDRPESVQINQQADPMLTQEAIQAQSAQVDVVSGATQTSQAFVQTMQFALSQAKS